MVIILAKGHLELRNTNKIMYICVVLPTVAKASRDGIVVASNVRLLCQTTSNCKYALSNDICFFLDCTSLLYTRLRYTLVQHPKVGGEQVLAPITNTSNLTFLHQSRACIISLQK
jgi:hypothetical protein